MRGLHSSTFQLNLSRLLSLTPPTVKGTPQNVLTLSRKVDECKPLPSMRSAALQSVTARLHQRLLMHCLPPGMHDSVSGSQHSPAVTLFQSSPLALQHCAEGTGAGAAAGAGAGAVTLGIPDRGGGGGGSTAGVVLAAAHFFVLGILGAAMQSLARHQRVDVHCAPPSTSVSVSVSQHCAAVMSFKSSAWLALQQRAMEPSGEEGEERRRRWLGPATELAHQLVVVARAPVTVTLVVLWQQSPVLTGGQLTPMESPHFLHPAKKLPLLHTSAGGGIGGGGIGGGGRGGGEYSTHVTNDVSCAPVIVLFVALSQHSGDVDGGLSGSPWPKP